MKKYNRCKIHNRCKCDFFDLSKICDKCDESCERKVAAWTCEDGKELSKDLVGPWEFGNYRFIASGSEDSFNDMKEDEFLACIEANEDIMKGSTAIQIFEKYYKRIPWSKNWFSIKDIMSIYGTKPKLYSPMYKREDFIVPKELDNWYDENITNKPERPKSLILLGGTRLGKTRWARSLGKHIYWYGMHNLDNWVDDVGYIIFDDWPWDFKKFELCKSIIGCQEQFTMTDKYVKKKTISNWSRPCIILNNPRCDIVTKISNDDNFHQTHLSWIEDNCTTVDIKDRKLFNNKRRDCDEETDHNAKIQRISID
jgi:hypothetical protein